MSKTCVLLSREHCTSEVGELNYSLYVLSTTESAISSYAIGKLRALGRELGKELAQFRSRFELRHGIKFLERAGKCVRETPHGARREFRVLRLEV